MVQILGQQDATFPASRTKADMIAPHASHLLTLTDAEQVNSFIRSAVRRWASRPGFHRASFPQVGGGYELTASWPSVQAVGDFDGIDFYFRAKYGEWEFETENKEGHLFPEGHPNYFVRRGTYDEKKPNAMTVDWSLRILRKCFVEFWDRPA